MDFEYIIFPNWERLQFAHNYKGWVGKYEVGIGDGFMYPPGYQAQYQPDKCPIGPRPQHKSTTW